MRNLEDGRTPRPKASTVIAASARRNHKPGKFLIVTWAGGGNVHPALGLARGLIARGHSVRILAPRALRERIEAAGCAFRPFPGGLEWDATRGRAPEDQEKKLQAILVGFPLAESVLAEVRAEPTDGLLVDCMLRNALSVAEVTGLPTATLIHVRYRFFADVPDPDARWWDLEPVNETRERLGLQPVLKGDERVVIKLWRRCDRALIVVPREFEDFEGALPPNVRYVGPVFEGNEGEATWDLPWPRNHPDPLVLVSFSTTYMHHEAVVDRVLAALEPLPVRVLVTLGGGLEPNEVAARRGMVVRNYVPHAIVLPHASLVVTHGGMGTVMAAFAHGVPMLCMPLGRDQLGNAEMVAVLRAGRTIAADASTEEVRSAVVDALGSDALRVGARRMAEIVAGYKRGAQAIDELESLLASSRPA